MSLIDQLDQRLAAGEVVILDGGMGTELQARGVPMDSDAWSGVANVTHQQIVRSIHEDYIRAGADVIVANTYAAARRPLEWAGYGDPTVDANRLAVEAAIQARENVADRPVAVAGSISDAAAIDVGGLGRPMPRGEELLAHYREQAQTQAEAGVDLFALEFITASSWGSLGVQAAHETGLPVWLGVSANPPENGQVITSGPEGGIRRSSDAVGRYGCAVDRGMLRHRARPCPCLEGVPFQPPQQRNTEGGRVTEARVDSDIHVVDVAGTRIAAVRATPINIPLEAPYRWSVGTFPGFTKTIVEVESEDGLVGLGEAPSSSAVSVIDTAIAPTLIGADPANLADCERRCLPPVRVMRNSEDGAVLRAWGGVEIALWDLVGKTQNRSIASLLGGRVRDRVLFTEYFATRLECNGRGGERTPADVARYCAEMAERYGSQAFEGKVGVDDLETEIAMVREVRAAIGDDAVLRLDANKRWDVITALEALRRLEPYAVQSIEDPVRSPAEMVRLRPATAIAFSSHEPDLALAARLGVPDAFVLNLAVLGGIRRTVAFINACDELGVSVWFYSPDTGVMNAAYLQVAAALDCLSEPSQTLLRWHTDDVIDGGPFKPTNGGLDVPDGPGLGVELDREALVRCRERFVTDGPYSAYDDPSRPGRFSRWV